MKVEMCYKDSIVSPSYINLLGDRLYYKVRQVLQSVTVITK